MRSPVFRIALVNMPFGALGVPSLALTQLKAAVERAFDKRVALDLLYLNLECVDALGGREIYNHALSGEGYLTGFGDWTFRQAAFPSTPDNTPEYLSRFYFDDRPETLSVRRAVESRRAGIPDLLNSLIDQYRMDEYDLVGFTALFAQTLASCAMARALKKRRPALITVMGGAACEGVMGRELVRQIDSLDYVFSGPALVSFPGFVARCLDADAEGRDRIDGVFSRTNAARWPGEQASSDAPRTVRPVGNRPDINAPLPLDYAPFLDALGRAFPGGDVRPILLFETSRGCCWGEKKPCAFCGLNGLLRHYDAMSPARAIEQFRELFRFADRCGHFLAVDNIMPRNYVRDVFPRLSAPEHVMIGYEVKADLSEKDLCVLSRAGVRFVQPGIESLASSTLRRMNKGTSAFRNVRFLKGCLASGVTPDWNLLINSPGEEESVYEKYLSDLPRLHHLPPPRGAFPINFVRHSLYAEHAADFGLDLHPHDFCRLTFPFPESALANIACQFVDRSASAEAVERLNGWLDRLNGLIAEWRRRWRGEDGKPAAKLVFRMERGTPAVVDSRDGRMTICPLDGPQARALSRLAKPSSLSDVVIAADLRNHPEASAVLQAMKEHGWLFEENGRFLSLVTEEKHA